MHCGACEHPLVDHSDLEQPCPRCGQPVLRDGHVLLLAPLAHGFDALDLGTGLRHHLRCAPSVVEEDEEEDDALESLLQAHFPQLPQATRRPSDEPDAALGPAPRTWWRRAVVVSLSALVAAQVGFAIAPVPIDYASHAYASESDQPLADEISAHPGVQRCLVPHRALPVRQSEHPALLTVERTPGMSTPHIQVRSTHPVLASCLGRAAKRLPLPPGRYRVAVPITEG